MNKKIVSALTVAGLATFGMSSAASADSTYTIKRGDTLSSIARQHSVSVQALAAANQLSNPNMIFAGQQLSLTGNVQNQTKQVSQKQTGSTHTIQPGETLSRIAREYGVSVQELVALNHLSNPSMIYAGEELTVKGQAGSVAQPAQPAQPEVQSAKPAAPITQSAQQVDVNASTHTIKAGDTLSSIARQYGTTVDKLVALNHLNNAGMIFVGEQLTLRGEVAQPEAQPAKPAAPVAQPAKPEAQPAKPAAPVAQPAQPEAQPAKPAAPVAQPTQPEAQPAKPAAPVAQSTQTSTGSVYEQFIAAGGTDALWQNVVLPESGGNPNAVSPAGYRGLGQTMQAWGTGSVASQTQGMVNYAIDRYGSIAGAVAYRAANGWW